MSMMMTNPKHLRSLWWFGFWVLSFAGAEEGAGYVCRDAHCCGIGSL
jgi:hypothetical protein